MIRILFIHDKLVCGGAEQALFDLLRLLDKSIFDTTVFVINDGGEWEKKFLDAGIRVVNSYSSLVNSRCLWIRMKNFLLRKKIDYAREHKGKDLVKKALPKERFDLVVSYSVWRLQETGISSGKKRIKFIHGDVITNAYYGGIMENSKKLLSEFNKIICVSEQVAESFKIRIGLSDKVCVCYNPVDYERIVALADEEDSQIPKEKYICAVGRLTADKGFSRLIKIHKKLLEEGLDHKLMIVGEGAERDKLEETIQETQTQNSVILTGQKENPYPWMRNSLFTVCSSYTEGLPVVSMESVILGIPVVSSVAVVKELFGEEVCGILTENDDASLEDGMRKMLSDQEFYRRAKEGTVRRSKALNGKITVKAVENEFLDSIQVTKVVNK